MSFTDLLVIYLACGAPFGVYYAFTSRELIDRPMYYVKLAFNTLFWVQYAARLIFRNNKTRKFFDSEFERRVVKKNRLNVEIDGVRRRLETILSDSNIDFPVYQFRADFDGFAGLAQELAEATDEPADIWSELAKIAGMNDSPTSTRCLHRGNVARLRHHRSLAEASVLSYFNGIPRGNDKAGEILRDLQELILDNLSPAVSNGSATPTDAEADLRFAA